MSGARKLTTLALISLAILVSGCGLIPETESWNFLVYLDGDNNLEPFAIEDFNEMEQVGSSANVNILVLLDLYSSYGTKLYKITKDANTSRISSTVLISSTWDGSEKDMSDPATLRDFIIYCQQNYPADHTVLTLWNHGSGVWPRIAQSGAGTSAAGPFKGICWDDTTIGNENYLTTDEVAQALNGARQETDTKLDIINMDACLMQMLEVAYEWRDEADYLVGSEENVPGAGNDYALSLSCLTRFPWLSPYRLALGLVESYHATYDGTYEDTTYSALSLGQEFISLMDAFKAFATALKGTNDLAGVYAAWQGTTSFAGWGSECCDLYSFAGEVTVHVADPLVMAAAANLRQALSQAVIRHAETGWYEGKAYGLSVLIPSTAEWPHYSGSDQYVTLKLSQDTDWYEFIARFVAYTAGL